MLPCETVAVIAEALHTPVADIVASLSKSGVRVGIFYEGAYIFTTADSSLDVLDRHTFEHLYAPYINTNISSLTHPPCTTSR